MRRRRALSGGQGDAHFKTLSINRILGYSLTFTMAIGRGLASPIPPLSVDGVHQQLRGVGGADSRD